MTPAAPTSNATEQPAPRAEHRAWTWQGSAAPLDLKLKHVPMPSPAAGQVLVRNAAIGLNPVDWKVLGGALVDWRAGHVPGVDGAGEVVALGDGVSADWLGRRVAWHTSLHRDGSFAEHTVVDARALLRLPDALDFETAASFPCPALTAWLAIEKVPVKPGQPLLISGAGGAVGQYLVQLAAARGFVVTAMANARHRDRLLALGAADCIDGPLPDGGAWTGGRGYFAVIDAVSGDHAARMADALRANGHLVCVQDRVAQWPCDPFGLTLSMHEVALGALHQHGDDEAWTQLRTAGEQMLAALAHARLQPQERVVRPFEALAQLLDELRLRSFGGKPVVRVR
ncbi:zinc-binding dehydrogenase [Paraburkholderia bannensis]|uniref:zinc-binding dehydrogenase n=1 Tax=Paraburkholderia bannensis TaxID=765414 RepID=UPI002AB62354|nr:zinc-binding dehydrogenase [Paraburkholderia bannensis]